MLDSQKKSLSWFTERIGKKIVENIPHDGSSAAFVIDNFLHAEKLNMLQDVEDVIFSDLIINDRLSPKQIIDIATNSLIENSALLGIIVETTSNFPYFKIKYKTPDWFFIVVFNQDCFCLKPQVELNPNHFLNYERASELLRHLQIHEMLIQNINTLVDLKQGKATISYD